VNRVAQHPVKAFAVALGAVAALSIMDAVMKHLVLTIGIIAVSVWRAAANMAIAAILYQPWRETLPSRATLRIHIWRSVNVTLMAFLFFWGIGRIPLAQAIALTFIAPLLALLLAALTLKEKIGSRSVAGSFVAFAGVIVIVLGQARAEVSRDMLLGTAAIIGSAVSYAVNIVLMRRQAVAAKPLEINFFQCATILALWVLLLPVAGLPDFPAIQWPWLLVAACLSTSGTLLFAWAYARGPASYLSVTEYSGFLWAAVCGWVAFHESVSAYTLGGAALIVVGCLVAARGKVTEPPEIDVAA